MITLRPYQAEMIAGFRAAFRAGHRTVLGQLPTGGGKTALGSFMVGGSAAKGNVCWWLCHRRELVSQASQAFFRQGIPHGIIAAGRSSDPQQRVQVASIQTIARRLDRMPPPNLIVFDEAHHLGAAQWQAVFDAFPDALVIGLSATPWRLDGVGLGRWFSTMVSGPSVSWLIENGFLSPYRLFAPSTVDVSSVAVRGGDFQRESLSALMDKPTITGDAVQHYRKLAMGKRAVVFAVSIEHSQHVVAQFRAAGIPADHVDGKMDHASRDAAVERFARGETLILSNADLLGEGWDVPAIEVVILLRPTASLSLHLQQIGRGLRVLEGKTEALILDHAGNTIRHGLPDDDFEWTLDDREKRKRKQDSEPGVPIRTCGQCFRVHRVAPKCPACGYVYPVQAREVEEKEGELQELSREQIAAMRKAEEKQARSLEDLVKLARARGYKNPEKWAEYRHNGRLAARARYEQQRWERYA